MTSAKKKSLPFMNIRGSFKYASEMLWKQNMQCQGRLENRHFLTRITQKPYLILWQSKSKQSINYSGVGGPKNSPSTEVWKISFLNKTLHIWQGRIVIPKNKFRIFFKKGTWFITVTWQKLNPELLTFFCTFCRDYRVRLLHISIFIL